MISNTPLSSTLILSLDLAYSPTRVPILSWLMAHSVVLSVHIRLPITSNVIILSGYVSLIWTRDDANSTFALIAVWTARTFSLGFQPPWERGKRDTDHEWIHQAHHEFYRKFHCVSSLFGRFPRWGIAHRFTSGMTPLVFVFPND